MRSLGKYHDRDTAKIITRYLSADSFRNTLGEAAVEAIRSLDDPSFASSLRKALEKREREFTFRGFGQALDTLGYIERNEDDRSGVRTFLTGYVNHPNETIRISAVGALGTLGDPKATAVVESFSRDDSRDRMQRTAKEALRKLREQKDMVPEEVVSLRETVDELRKENEDLRKDVDDIKKRLDVKDGDDDNDHD